VLQQSNVSDAEDSKSGGWFRPDIQGLRAVAVLAVIAFHAHLPIPGGFTGVDVFFVISGFVIAGMLMRSWRSGKSAWFPKFYWRRFLRLTPALSVTVCFAMLVSSFALSPLGSQQVAAKTGIAAMLLCANFVISALSGGYFALPTAANPLLNTWSLSVEEQFYLVFPAVLFIGWLIGRRVGRGFTGAALATGLIASVSLGLMLGGYFAIALPGVSHPPTFYSPVTRVWEFAAGALLVILFESRAVPKAFAQILGWVGVAGLLASFFLINSSIVYPGLVTVVPVLAASCVLVSGMSTNSPSHRVLSRPSLVKVGDTSYSLYLWHWPVIVFAVAMWPRTPWIPLAAALVSVLPALAVNRWIENPLRGAHLRKVSIRIALSLVIVVPPIALGVGLLISANQGFWVPTLQNLQARAELRFGNADGCTGVPLADAKGEDTCTQDPLGTGTPVYLIGDSMAEQNADAVSSIAAQHNSPFLVRAQGGCPFLLAQVFLTTTGGEFSQNCGEAVDKVVLWLSSAKPGVVAIANADFYFRDDSIHVQTPSGDSFVKSADKVSAYIDAELALVTKLQSYGHRVVLVQANPNFRLNSYTESVERWSGILDCPTVRVLTNSCGSTAAQTLQDAAARQQPVWTAIQTVARETGSSVVDVRDLVCPGGMCPTQQGGTLMFREYQHLTVAGAKKLIPGFARVLDPLLG
jgi:peptidoglycan/LPS O-acetylase OafA/YrhL